MQSDFHNLQTAIADRLKGDEILSALEVIPEDRNDLATAIQTALGKLGVCLIVGTAKVRVSNPNLPGPVFDGISFIVTVCENVLLNRTPGSAQLDALTLAIQVHKRLHHWRPVDVTSFSGRTILSAADAITYVQKDDLLMYDANFNLGSE